jgi:glucokinase
MTLALDSRVVLTLDAGGTTFAFSAIQGGRAAVPPIVLPAQPDDLERCLDTLVDGFQRVRESAPVAPVALSFAFPGPADFVRGVIGDCNNLPAFRGGVALGPFLEDHFRLPVFINNDGDLFAYGEALAGLLPETNRLLEGSGSSLRYRSLFGVTFGTGFGAGLVHDGRLYLGDNGGGMEIWALRAKRFPHGPAEEGVSIRGVRRAFAEAARIPFETAPDPQTIAAIAQGEAPGERGAAMEAFRAFGEEAGNALANALTLLDTLVVIGGGLSAAHRLFMPALLEEMNSHLASPAGARYDRTGFRAFDLDDPAGLAAFLQGEPQLVRVARSDRQVAYDPCKRTGVGVSRLGTAAAVGVGAYAYALDRLDKV